LLLVIAATVAFVFALQFHRVFSVFGRDASEVGYDLHVVCSSLQALANGLDPYAMSRPMPLPYPLLHVVLLKPLCAIDVDIPNRYMIIYLAIVACCGIALWPFAPSTILDRFLVLSALFISFRAFFLSSMAAMPSSSSSLSQWPRSF
jgi:hypothetical protein